MKLEELREKFSSRLSLVKCKSDILRLNSEFKNEIRKFYSEIKNIGDIHEKKQFGKNVNSLKLEIQKKIDDLMLSFQENVKDADLDPYIFKPSIKPGSMHPLIKLYKKMEKILINLGFSVVQGPEIELDKYNFERLNIPYFHPARDMQDTFYVMSPKIMLRSHTSSVQIRSMENMSPPISVISPGTVYRVDDIDTQHTPMFYQVEGLVVGEGVSFANLKFVLTTLIKYIFGESVEVRFRPTYYPYTEPSAAIDMSCLKCGKRGCSICSGSGWITVLGSGMVHPKVLEDSGIDSEKFTGFAFGLGLNRLAMIYYGMDGIKKFYENDISLWNQL